MEAAVFFLKKTWGTCIFDFSVSKLTVKKSKAALTTCTSSIFCTFKLYTARDFCCSRRLTLMRFRQQSFLVFFPLGNVATYMQTHLKQKFLELVFETDSRVYFFVFCHNVNTNQKRIAVESAPNLTSGSFLFGFL
jgi:hypothetical protein